MNLFKGFFPNLQFDPPTVRDKRVLLVYPAAKFDKTY